MNLSLIIPVFNEVENLERLDSEIHRSLKSLGAAWEVIYVDDGSTDGSFGKLRAFAARDPAHIRVVALRRNFGQTAAISAGIDHADGEAIILMDADLQNDPQDIPMMMELVEEGYDVVSGWRKDRKDSFLTRILPSRVANWIISRVTGVHLHDYGCTLKAYRREVLQGFRLYGEMHRFIPAYAGSVGAKIIEVPVRHHPREHGETKYGLDRTLKVLLDLFTVKFLMSFFHKPIYLFGGAGLTLMAASGAALLFLLVRRLWIGTSVLDSPIFQASTMIMILGFQSILMGLIAELLVRTYHESQAKPTYSVRRIIRGSNAPSEKPDRSQG